MFNVVWAIATTENLPTVPEQALIAAFLLPLVSTSSKVPIWTPTEKTIRRLISPKWKFITLAFLLNIVLQVVVMIPLHSPMMLTTIPKLGISKKAIALETV